MIRPLRTFHRRVFVCIAIAVPVVMFTAVAGRAPQPGESVVPFDAPTTPNRSSVVSESAELWRSVAILTRVLRLESDGYEVELSVAEINGQPDLLLYWSDDDASGRLPESALLLGPYGGGTQRFAVPAGTDPREGMLILYSLAHQSVFATAEVPNNGR